MREVIIKLGVIYKNGKSVSETEAKIIAEANNFEYVEDFKSIFNS